MDLPALQPLDARIPRWDITRLAARSCPFCGTDNRSVFTRPDKLPVAFCSECECWYVSDIPSESEIKKLYTGYYHEHHPTDLSEKSISVVLENAHTSINTDWQLQTLSTELGGLEGKRILDVGCGTGSFLLSARLKGAEVIGCDLSPEACEFAKNKLGIQVYQSTLSSSAHTIGDVDAVVMRDFIEHPAQPLTDIQAAVGILKPGGLLLFITPNGGEAGRNADAGKAWVGFRVDLEHLQYLSPCTINRIARTLDLRIERLNAFGFPGLEGKDKLPGKPVRELRTRDRALNILKRIPYLHTIVKAARAIKAGGTGENPDPRLGSYHLFVVLRKPCGKG